MSQPRLVSKVGALETWHLPSEQRGRMTLVERADLTSNLRANEQDKDIPFDPLLGRKVASIDVVHIGIWLNEAGISWREFWQTWTAKERRRWLARKVNSREFYKMKTTEEERDI